MVQRVKVVIALNTKTSTRVQFKKKLLKLTFVIGLITIQATGYANNLNICYDQWAPMTIFPTKQSKNRGVVIDMLQSIYLEKGYTLTFYEVPLARGLDMVSEGLCDILPEYLYSKEAENVFDFAQVATFAYTTAFVVRQDDTWQYNGVKSIRNKRIATGPGWDYSSMSVDYQNYIDDPNHSNFIEVIAGYDDVVDRIFRMISENRIDLYADNELVLQHALHRLNLEDKLKIIRPGLENKLIERPIFSKKIPLKKRQVLIEIWNQGRSAIKGNKEEIFLQKYNIKIAD